MATRSGRCRNPIAGRAPRALGLVMSVGVVLWAVPAQTSTSAVAQAAGQPHAASITTPPCAWQGGVTAGTQLGWADTGAVYRDISYVVQTGLTIKVTGTFPAARYMSFTTYNLQGLTYSSNGISSTLTDYRIAPDAGSVNPWQQSAAPGGRYTVTLRTDTAPGQKNTLPLAPPWVLPGARLFLSLRVYAPSGPLTLPTVTFSIGSQSQTLPVCASTSTVQPLHAPPTAAAATTAAPAFAPVNNRSFGAAADITYLAATMPAQTDGQVVVIRAKAPTAPRGSVPTPWPGPYQVRYWSLCSYWPYTYWGLWGTTVGCVHDDHVVTDGGGYYTVALGTAAQQAQLQALPGVTFLPVTGASSSTHLLLRNLLGAFPQAIPNLPSGSTAEQAAAVMGEYYPRTAICSLSTLTASGAAGCFGG